MGTLRVGCSGWHYADWIGPFYPVETPRKHLLRAYAARFSTTEINNSFYRVPTEEAVRTWRHETPNGFLFAWKASRYITHRKRLKEVEESVAYILQRMDGLGEKFGPVLWQLPPQFDRNDARLAAFLKLLPSSRLHVFEFRNSRWYEQSIFTLLRDHNVALCISDHSDAPAPRVATAGHVYIRLHGSGADYGGRYRAPALESWSDAIAAWRHAGHSVFVYFDNDVEAAAPHDAERLKEMLGERHLHVD